MGPGSDMSASASATPQTRTHWNRDACATQGAVTRRVVVLRALLWPHLRVASGAHLTRAKALPVLHVGVGGEAASALAGRARCLRERPPHHRTVSEDSVLIPLLGCIHATLIPVTSSNQHCAFVRMRVRWAMAAGLRGPRACAMAMEAGLSVAMGPRACACTTMNR